MKKNISATLIIAAFISACSTSPQNIPALYVSPLQYQAYECDQLASEFYRIQTEVNRLNGQLNEAARKDAVLTGTGVILFWPALLALGGTQDQESEYARLKGTYNAVQHAAFLKKCPEVEVVTVAAPVKKKQMVTPSGF